MELTIQHLAAYLPYGLELSVPTIWKDFTCKLVVYNHSNSLKNGMDINTAISHEAKPILYPLDLYALIVDKFDKGSDAEFMGWFNDEFVDLDSVNAISVDLLPFGGVQWLLKNKYDVFDLIGQNLAVDVNNLDVNPYL